MNIRQAQLPQGWEIKKLGEVCRFINGRAYSKPELLDKGKYPVLRVGNFFTNNKWYYSNLELDEDKYCANGDLLYAWSASFGPRIWEGEKVIYHYHIWKVIPNSKIVTKEFLFQLLEWDTEALKTAYGTGTTMMHVGKGSIEKRLVPIPPLPEQQRIVSILDECFAAIDKAKANAEQNLKNAAALFESYLQGVFEKKGDGWEEKTLKEVCAKITDGTHQTPKYFDDGVIFLSSKNVTSGKIDWDNIKYIDEKQHLEMHKRVAPRVGDILLAKNGTTGVAAMVDREVVFDIYVSLAHIRVLDEVTPEFMLFFINSGVAKKQFNKRLKGSGVPNLHLEEIREVVISFPKSLKEQRTIVHKLDSLRVETQKLEAVYQKKIAYLEELKKSILHKAFAGELKVSEPLINAD